MDAEEGAQARTCAAEGAAFQGVRAHVVRELTPEGMVVVDTPDGPREARIAVVGRYLPRPSDRVLVSAGERGELYVIGVLRALRPAELLAEATDGTTVSRVFDADGHTAILVRSSDGRVLIEHREHEGRTVVHGGRGGVEVLATEGPLVLASDHEVRLEGRAGVSLRSEARVKVEACAEGKTSRLVLDPVAAHLASPNVDIEGRSIRLAARSLLRFAADVVHTSATTVRQKAEATEIDVGQLVERARETYREVEGLAQTRAGELRLVAEEAFRALAKHTLLKAREDMKLRAEKNIYLD